MSILTIVLLLVVGSGAYLYFFYQPRYLETESFIKKHMLNPNGTLATYLSETPAISPDLAHGREALSESLGLWLEYAVENKDKALFQQNYAILRQYFFAPEGFVYWKISPDGKSDVTTNALVDDLRLVDALLAAHQLWGQEEWAQTAGAIGNAVSLYLVRSNTFVDFYDRKYNKSADVLTLSYLDPRPLKKLGQWKPAEQPLYDRAIGAIQAIPNDGTFFPKSYHLLSGQYAYDPVVNLIDQLLIALHRASQGIPSPELTAFLKNEFEIRGLIYGGYDRMSHEAPVKFESPSVYALAILYSLERNDTEWALALYKRMLQLQHRSGEYQGGYVSDNQTHIFDNVFPLLAEVKLYRTKMLPVMYIWMTEEKR
ncbi:glycosyl hydrolase family 8 [Anaerospora hongkongensis]|uniref:glycosyl hydrolase family 8 n=1 Tax=Anaerospora hongkongensis TaxID=244830 RepID=UPI00289A2F1C|nr:glycosyl hydrolase family 8 [Anaerospora hongkongensis]